MPQPRGLAAAAPHDVLCAVRRFISDREWAQPPVVLIPQGGLSRLRTRLPTGVVPRVRTAERSEQWRRAADVVQRFVAVQPIYLRSVSYLRDLADGLIGVGALPAQLPWHNSNGAVRPQPFVLPLGLQGQLRPTMRFQAEWRR